MHTREALLRGLQFAQSGTGFRKFDIFIHIPRIHMYLSPLFFSQIQRRGSYMEICKKFPNSGNWKCNTIDAGIMISIYWTLSICQELQTNITFKQTKLSIWKRLQLGGVKASPSLGLCIAGCWCWLCPVSPSASLLLVAFPGCPL